MKYFEYFPYTGYSFNNAYLKTETNLVRNILARNKFLNYVLDNIGVYYDYDVQDSDTAQTIAYKYYKDENRYWLILLYNLHVDPYFSWPMRVEILENQLIPLNGSTVAVLG